MVFNTGAALLDAIVLAVVSKDEEGTYGCEDCRRTVVWKYTTENVGAEIEGIIR